MTQDRLSLWRIARTARQGLVLGLAFLGAQLRRLPGAVLVERFSPLIVAVLLAGAVVSLGVWGAQKSPQRISLAELAVGALAPMQTWIIVSGDVRAQEHGGAGYVYRLTDPAALNASLRISSEIPLAEGWTTVSGRLLGGDARAPAGFAWLGSLLADPVLASEQSPPWIAIGLALIAVLMWLLAPTSYPVLFIDPPRPTAAPRRRLTVSVRHGWPPTGASTPGTLELEPGAPPELHVPGGETRQLRVHSAKSSVEPGRLQWLTGSEPVLVVRAARGDVTLSFASTDDRDRAHAALVASVATRPRRNAI